MNVELNGRAPQPAELLRAGYGHFTVMQVRDARVRGFAQHLARLDDGNEAFFGARSDFAGETRLRELIRHALRGTGDATVRVSMLPGPDGFAHPDVLVVVDDPVPDTPAPPLRVRLDPYERDWPEHKHAATMGLRYARWRAERAGFDDALFVSRDGRISEGSTWNVAFWDGDQVLWPRAPALKGVTMVLLQIALTMTGTPWSIREIGAGDLPDLLAAAAVNSSCPAQPIGVIDDVKYGGVTGLTDALTRAWATVPWDEI
ncbi:aminotransferase class IV [Mangrovihabitans endophyticus]|uniref:Branched-chain amino acid aminotransferase/4-amino-4-deoxychorismate lyase n=1 Tax=Mangrovihabitans endophyticus TaxID=1751298 RepID=A0A8J3C169_9ACTN|nr:aminotransferase class IV [Mangrovihabitans endophyticus]GGL03725.1 hypothetical protein GCM10012284_42890 [Mangrovihabitans endophyticus]